VHRALWPAVYDNISTPKQFTSPLAAAAPDAQSVSKFDFKNGVNLSYSYGRSGSGGESGSGESRERQLATRSVNSFSDLPLGRDSGGSDPARPRSGRADPVARPRARA